MRRPMGLDPLPCQGSLVAEGLEDLLRACTVRVTGGPRPGAGFFVAPGKVLTCVHVIANCADGVKVSPGLRVLWDRDGDQPAEFPAVSTLTATPLGSRAVTACTTASASSPPFTSRSPAPVTAATGNRA